MKIPKRTKIGWKWYKTRYGTFYNENGDELHGECDYDACEIRISEADSLEQREATYIHEVLHAISDMYTLDLSEDTVTRLADTLYTVICDNKYSERMKNHES